VELRWVIHVDWFGERGEDVKRSKEITKVHPKHLEGLVIEDEPIQLITSTSQCLFLPLFPSVWSFEISA